jgi:hypothetical protein
MEVRFRNLGTVNKNEVILTHNGKTVGITFSYGAAVECNGIVRQNDWSTITGKLLNDLEPDKSKRVDAKTFAKHMEKELKELFKKEKK